MEKSKRTENEPKSNFADIQEATKRFLALEPLRAPRDATASDGDLHKNE